MTNYPKGSTGANDAKNQKIAAVLFVLGFIVLHVLAFVIPAVTHFHGWRIALTGIAVIALAVLCISLWNNGDLTEDEKWPHMVVIALAFASAVCISYCASC